MRLEIVIPDSTAPELQAKLVALTLRLSARPELVREIEFSGEDEDAAIQAMFTPERMAKIKRSQEQIRDGNGLTLDQMDTALSETKAEWLIANPV